MTKKEAQRLIAKGRLFVDGKPMTYTAGEIEGEFEFMYFKPISKGLVPSAVYDEFVLFDKPSGMLIHPLNRHTEYSLIDELKYQFGKDANIAHRIDQETSGLVLCARNKESERDIKMMFQEREMKKKYLAMVHGNFKDELCVEAPLLRAKHESALVRMVVKVDEKGKHSKTLFKPLKYFPEQNMTLVECSPVTGRQHQIRVHLESIGHKIVGDPIYGVDEDIADKYLLKQLTLEERLLHIKDERLRLQANFLKFQFDNNTYEIYSKLKFKVVK